MQVYEVLRRPVITEKSTMLKDSNRYAFEVLPKANKNQVKEAVEKAFNVKVKAVNTMTMPSKTRRVGRRQVLTPSWKKAIVTLMEGHKIEFFEGV
ncbi:50S ribosomal protein L23 [Chloroflexota bacterium]